jgi:hypothetical protein
VLLDALVVQTRKVEERTKQASQAQLLEAQAREQRDAPRVGQVLLVIANDEIGDDRPFGEVRRQIYDIMSKAELKQIGERLTDKSGSGMALRWAAVDKETPHFRKQLRPLAMVLDFSTAYRNSPWLDALNWIKATFARKQRLDEQPLADIPPHTIPRRLRSHLFELDENGQAIKLNEARYEFWIYRQIRKLLDAGELHLDDSTQYRAFGDELIPLGQKTEALRQLGIPWLARPVGTQLDALFTELHELWLKR